MSALLIVGSIAAAVYAFNKWAERDDARRKAAKEAVRSTPEAIKRRARAEEENLRARIAVLERACNSLVEPPSWDERKALADARWQLEYLHSNRRRRPMREV
jgi:hypothetical protein